MRRIATVINFCTNDLRFLEECVGEARQFSAQIIIPVCDHFFDGTPENYALLEWVYTAFPDVLFLEFAFEPQGLYYPFIPALSAEIHSLRHWHNTSRWISYYFLKEEIDYLLFLDVDEVMESYSYLRWLAEFDYNPYAAIRFASYWYFREARYQATSWPDAGLMVNRESLHADLFFDPNERKGLYNQIAGEKIRHVLGMDGKPLMHHYSWVRTKEEMLKKTATWGHHRDEANWPQLIEEEFSQEFQGKDFSGEFTYQTIAPLFDPLRVALPATLPLFTLEEHVIRLESFANVQRVNRSDIFQKDIKHRFFL